MTAIYNEWEAYPAAWLRNLIAAGHIADGVVDERSIVELKATELVGHGQRHFFAGIGGWSLALRLAGVADNATVWTASCPCQPFSDVGRRGGADDDRHLWPVLLDLVRECRPPIIFGEQVAGEAGRAWLESVQGDLEALGYAVGAADLAAASVGAPHPRQRLFFGAHLPDAIGYGLEGHLEAGPAARATDGGRGGGPRLGAVPVRGDVVPAARSSRVRVRVPADRGVVDEPVPEGADWMAPEPRPVALAHGVPDRVGRLRAYGNAIVPQVAAQFIGAFLDAVADTRAA